MKYIFKQIHILTFMLLICSSLVFAQSDLDTFINDLPPDLPQDVRNSMIEQERQNLVTNPISKSPVSVKNISVMVLIGSGCLIVGILVARNKIAQKPIKFDPKKYGLEE